MDNIFSKVETLSLTDSIFDHEKGQFSQLDANLANTGHNGIKVDKKPYFSPEGLS